MVAKCNFLNCLKLTCNYSEWVVAQASCAGFRSRRPGFESQRRHFSFVIYYGCAITIYLSSLKIQLLIPTGLVAQAVSPLGCQLQAVPGWYVRVRILLLTHRDMTAAGCGNGLGTVMSLPRRFERGGNVRTGE